jgi:hypothetical protein
MTTKLTRQITLLGIVVIGGIALASGSAAAYGGASAGYDKPGQDHPVSVSAPDSVTTGDAIELELKSPGYAKVKIYGEIETADGYKEVKTGTTVHEYEEIHIDTDGVGDTDGEAEFYIIADGDEQYVEVDLVAPESGSDLPPWAQGLPAWFIDWLESLGWL